MKTEKKRKRKRKKNKKVDKMSKRNPKIETEKSAAVKRQSN